MSEEKQKKVIIMMNCSLAPSPESLARWNMAQWYAGTQGIQASMVIMKQTVNGFLAGHSMCYHVLGDKSITHLLMASDDTIPEEDIIVRLVNDDKPIISGIYRMRDPNTNQLAIHGLDAENFGDYINEGRVMQREFSSGHSLCIKREVIEAVYEAHPELDFMSESGDYLRALFIPYIKDKKIYMDDWAFCQRAKDLGYQCWVDFGVKLTHKCDVWLGI